MTEKPHVYWIAGSPYAWRILLALEVKRVAYGSHILEASKKEQKSPAYLKINPNGTVPALKLGDMVVTQSLAILAFLDAHYPTPSLLGETPAETGAIWQAVLEFDATLGPVITDDFNRPLFRGRADEMADSVKAAAEKIHNTFAGYEDRLGTGGWLAGDRISAFDIAVYPFIEASLRAAGRDGDDRLGLKLLPLSDSHRALETWRTRVAALPGAENAWPPHWK
jgi:glutathione S-transferase